MSTFQIVLNVVCGIVLFIYIVSWIDKKKKSKIKKDGD
jgi:hypothetical protein